METPGVHGDVCAVLQRRRQLDAHGSGVGEAQGLLRPGADGGRGLRIARVNHMIVNHMIVNQSHLRIAPYHLWPGSLPRRGSSPSLWHSPVPDVNRPVSWPAVQRRCHEVRGRLRLGRVLCESCPGHLRWEDVPRAAGAADLIRTEHQIHEKAGKSQSPMLTPSRISHLVPPKKVSLAVAVCM
jgi:hypothetical protein